MPANSSEWKTLEKEMNKYGFAFENVYSFHNEKGEPAEVITPEGVTNIALGFKNKITEEKVFFNKPLEDFSLRDNF